MRNNETFTMFQCFQWKPKENDGVDQGIDAVTPKHLWKNQTRKSGGCVQTLKHCFNSQRTIHYKVKGFLNYIFIGTVILLLTNPQTGSKHKILKIQKYPIKISCNIMKPQNIHHSNKTIFSTHNLHLSL